MLEQRLRYVKVTNGFDTPYVDMFDGIPVTIDPGGTQELRPEQALHMFGYTEDANKRQMLLHTSKRMGWNTAKHLEVDESGKSLAERMFDKLTIEPVVYKLVEETPAEPDAPIPAEAMNGADEHEVEQAPPPPKFRPAPPKNKPGAQRRTAPADE